MGVGWVEGYGYGCRMKERRKDTGREKEVATFSALYIYSKTSRRRRR